MSEFFPGIPKIEYEGPQSDNPLAFKFYTSELHPNSSSMKTESKIEDISDNTNSGAIINTTLEICSSQGNNNDNTNINIKD